MIHEPSVAAVPRPANPAARPASPSSHPVAVSGERVVGASLWGLGWQSTTLLASLVTTPFVLRLLGPASYGVLALVNVLVGYASVGELGMSQASTKFGAEAYSRGDRTGEAGVIWTALIVLLAPTAAGAGALFVASGWLADHVLHVPPSLRPDTVWALRFAALAFVARAFSGVLSTPHLVRLRLDLAAGITNAGAILQILTVPLILWWLDTGLVGAVAVIAAFALVTAAAQGSVACRFVPELTRPQFVRNLLRPILHYGTSTTAMLAVAMVLTHAEKFLIAGLLSTEALAYYAVAFALARLLMLVPASIGQVLLPAFAQLQAGSDRRPLQALYTRSVRGLLLVNLPLAAMLAFSSGPLLTVWAGPDYATMSRVPLAILAVGCLVDGLSFAPRMLLQATGHPALIAKILIVTVGPYVATAVVFIRWWGIAGAAAAWTMRTTVECVLLAVAARRTAGASFRIDAGAFPAFVAALLALLLPTAVNTWSGGSLALTTMVGLLSIGTYAALTWMRILTREERVWAMDYCHRMLRLANRG